MFTTSIHASTKIFDTDEVNRKLADRSLNFGIHIQILILFSCRNRSIRSPYGEKKIRRNSMKSLLKIKRCYTKKVTTSAKRVRGTRKPSV